MKKREREEGPGPGQAASGLGVLSVFDQFINHKCTNINFAKT
jgi:hypothetical protein